MPTNLKREGFWYLRKNFESPKKAPQTGILMYDYWTLCRATPSDTR